MQPGALPEPAVEQPVEQAVEQAVGEYKNQGGDDAICSSVVNWPTTRRVSRKTLMLKIYIMSRRVGDVSMLTGYQVSLDYQVVMVQHVAFTELA